MISNLRVLVPAGRCPAVLNDVSFDSVKNWIDSIKRNAPANHKYEVSVYRYWLLNFFTFGSQEYKEADSNITTIIGTKARIFDLMDRRIKDEKG